ncbi:type II toxin-antitoxin system RelE/ParE family toxin [Riemerella anatipestifer]|uniref:type II toxin-antitoxin system RelE/ParE family toxin n=1 Tax=Riemerella anatipestifer TaxID=34085 RepID=UPI00129ECB22|nr:type II toxin-antitoxin system RelE/ParE family toxin [Riemerella anatipestifer]MDY3318611.1 type II toxin-antitoxin system RelE/ParE family toxin [Riemerella anatipestifer]MDY3324880.1 type II toxin-antitoxin system RelE/ParE family toxin [Riemerella anatipestifer]MDY3353690.1 type II toxin-antitoxin system RelE/ParE family toxin [Riemerella anatipestifer]MRM83464.1 type II toxin-antitoxin system RelE/ParE family toxin [Riemerella anatipestifer]
MNKYRFRIEFLEEAKVFLDGLDEKTRDKIVYNIWKARSTNDKELFKKLQDEIWEFRTKYNKTYYRLFAFWDKTDKKDTVVISTHGLIKKTDKIPKNEIKRAEILREKYFNEKL